jgi:hypothetical protein
MSTIEQGALSSKDDRAGQVKVTLLVHLRAFAIRAFGDAGWERVLARARGDDRAVLDGLLLVGGWVSVGIWNRAIEAFLADNYSDPREAMGTFAEFVAENDLHSLFRLALKVGAPDFVLGRTASLYNRYFEAGTFAPQKIATRHWLATLTAPRHEDEGPGLFTCDAGVCAWLKHALELSGTRPTVVHSKCRFRHSPHCEYDMTW